MKKSIAIGIVILCAHITVFANDNRLSFGFEYGNFFENRTDGGVGIETVLSSPGLDFIAYHLWDNFGFFQNHSFLFPNNVKTNIAGYDYFFQYNFIMGPAFRVAFTEIFDMTLGLGLSFGPTIGEYNKKSLSQFNVGMGGDIGFALFVNKMVYVHIGSIFSYLFASATGIANGTYDDDGDENKTTEWSRNYTMTAIRPYLKMGLLLQ
jgi:hypothetical protein